MRDACQGVVPLVWALACQIVADCGGGLFGVSNRASAHRQLFLRNTIKVSDDSSSPHLGYCQWSVFTPASLKATPGIYRPPPSRRPKASCCSSAWASQPRSPHPAAERRRRGAHGAARCRAAAATPRTSRPSRPRMVKVASAARQAALGSSALPERSPATASGPRASRLQSRRCHRL